MKQRFFWGGARAFCLAAGLAAGCAQAPVLQAPPVRNETERRIQQFVQALGGVKREGEPPRDHTPAELAEIKGFLRGQGPRSIPFLIYAVETGYEAAPGQGGEAGPDGEKGRENVHRNTIRKNTLRKRSLEVLVDLGGPAVDPLLKALERRRDDPPVRNDIIGALGKLGPENGAEPVGRFLLEGGLFGGPTYDFMTRAAAAGALGQIASVRGVSGEVRKTAVLALNGALQKDGDPFVRDHAGAALARVASAQGTPEEMRSEILSLFLAAAVKDPDPVTRAKLAEELGPLVAEPRTPATNRSLVVKTLDEAVRREPDLDARIGMIRCLHQVIRASGSEELRFRLRQVLGSEKQRLEVELQGTVDKRFKPKVAAALQEVGRMLNAPGQ